MSFVIPLLRTGALLLLVASLLLPSLALSAPGECCPSCDGGNGGACPEEHREDGGETRDGGTHSKAFCGCGSCDLPSFLPSPHDLPSPGLSGTVGLRTNPVPPPVTIATLDRPPSA